MLRKRDAQRAKLQSRLDESVATWAVLRARARRALADRSLAAHRTAEQAQRRLDALGRKLRELVERSRP